MSELPHDSVVSFEDQRLARLGSLFSTTEQESGIARVGAGREVPTGGQETARADVDRLETGEVMPHTFDRSPRSAGDHAPVIDLLGGYQSMFTDMIDSLDDELETFNHPPGSFNQPVDELPL